MEGTSIIAGEFVGGAEGTGGQQFRGVNPANGRELEPLFYEATDEEVDRALAQAAEAFPTYRRKKPEEIAAFLEAIAGEIEALGDELLQRAHEETALPLVRLTGERGRTAGQLRMFAELVREGSWVEATI
ncbi:MAG TPA: aldehyde dehydrogenase family protein, partial [Pyrinomonadaceae bacterium]|nr:aldehyde dehydrogenase family protein [Pyrinomonadaceae bacterium]